MSRTGQHIFSETDHKIDEFCAVFDDFKNEFYGRVTVKTQVVVTRILDEVQGLGVQNVFTGHIL